MGPSREVEVDVATAVESMAWVTGVHALKVRDNPDAFQLAVVLSPFSMDALVQTHYALVTATKGHDVPGRILYVDDSQPRPLPMSGARMIMPTPAEKAEARTRIAALRETPATSVPAVTEAFEQLAAQAQRERPTETTGGQPYRFPETIRWSLAKRVLEVVKDPFGPDARPLVLVADSDPDTAARLRYVADVVHVTDGWEAVDELTQGKYDLALTALVVGDLPGAKILRMVTTNRPDVAGRIYFLANADTIAQGPTSSASGRVLARPVTSETVEKLLGTLGRAP